MRCCWTLALSILFAAVASPLSARCRQRLSRAGREGQALGMQGRWAEAVEKFVKATPRGRARAVDLHGYGYASFKAEEYVHAADAYRRLSRLKPNAAIYQVNLALALYSRKLITPEAKKEADRALRRARKLRPEDPDVMHNCAVVLHRGQQGEDRDEVLQLAEKAAAAAPGRGYILTELGDIRREFRMYEAARIAYELALERDRLWPPTYLGLAELYLELGEFDQARYYLDEFWCHVGTGERWSEECRRADNALTKIEAGTAGRPRPGQDKEEPSIEILLPRLSGEGRRAMRYVLTEDRGFFGVLGIVRDDRAIKEVRVNSAAATFIPLRQQAVEEIERRLQEKTDDAWLQDLPKGQLILDKHLILDKDVALGEKVAGEGRLYLYYAPVLLSPRGDTSVEIVATDFEGRQTRKVLRLSRGAGTRQVRVPRYEKRGSGQTWGIFVGVDSYQHLPAWRTLLFAALDAERLYRVFRDGGAIEPDHALLMHDYPGAVKPTRANLEQWIADVKGRIKPEDTVIFFFSGHGAADKSGSGRSYLLTADFDRDRVAETSFHKEWFEKHLKSLDAGRIILFLDACHAGAIEQDGSVPPTAGSSEVRGSAAGEVGVVPLAEGPYERLLEDLSGAVAAGGRFRVFASCRASERSYESSDLQAGVFGHHLVRGFAGDADGNNDGVVGLNEVVRYVGTQVERWCSGPPVSGERSQHPVLLGGRPEPDVPLTYPVTSRRR